MAHKKGQRGYESQLAFLRYENIQATQDYPKLRRLSKYSANGRGKKQARFLHCETIPAVPKHPKQRRLNKPTASCELGNRSVYGYSEAIQPTP